MTPHRYPMTQYDRLRPAKSLLDAHMDLSVSEWFFWRGEYRREYILQPVIGWTRCRELPPLPPETPKLVRVQEDPMPPELICPECEEELDHLDRIEHKVTHKAFDLWICHNEDCGAYGSIWNDEQPGSLNPGDPSGIY